MRNPNLRLGISEMSTFYRWALENSTTQVLGPVAPPPQPQRAQRFECVDGEFVDRQFGQVVARVHAAVGQLGDQVGRQAFEVAQVLRDFLDAFLSGDLHRQQRILGAVAQLVDGVLVEGFHLQHFLQRHIGHFFQAAEALRCGRVILDGLERRLGLGLELDRHRLLRIAGRQLLGHQQRRAVLGRQGRALREGTGRVAFLLQRGAVRPLRDDDGADDRHHHPVEPAAAAGHREGLGDARHLPDLPGELGELPVGLVEGGEREDAGALQGGAGAQLEHLAEADQLHDHGRRLEVDGGRPVVEPGRGEEARRQHRGGGRAAPP